ncbi:B12-binding domain-containing radical SAM protein [bacterium]|nr:B12-binding domain-containing radical SAM protein [bacterium]
MATTVALHLACFPQLTREWNNFAPVGLGYLISYAQTKVSGKMDFIVERKFEDVLAANPDIVGITYVTNNVNPAADCARRVKEELGSHVPVIVGGPHISTLPSHMIPNVDIAVLGEGEETFAELMQLWDRAGKFDPSDLAKVNGIIYRDEDGKYQRTPPRGSILELDVIPPPARDLYFDQWIDDKSEAVLITSRGCPYDCAFCSTVQHWGQNYRFHSNEYVIRELETVIARWNPEMVHFYDDLFIVRRERIIELCRMIRERGLHKGRMFTCFVRSNLLRDDVMEAFAKTNFKIIHIGFESGSDNVLATFNKQAADMKKNRQAVEFGRKYGLRFTSCFILAAPGETRRDILDTYQFVADSTDVFWTTFFSPLVVLPGTAVWQWAKAQGVSDEHLERIILTNEDLADMEEYYATKWVYLNEKTMPREEFLDLWKMGRCLENVVSKYSDMRRQLDRLNEDSRKATFAAENTPIVDIVVEKTKRRLHKIMPSGRGVPNLVTGDEPTTHTRQ